MAKVHNLKTVNPFFQQVKNRAKRFEIRKNDRDFKKGDFLMLEEYDFEKKQNTGAKQIVLIQEVWQDNVKFALKQDYCVLAIKFREEFTEEEHNQAAEILESMF